MKSIFVFAFVCLSNMALSQFNDLHIDLRFDQVYTQLYGPIYNINSTSNHVANQGTLTWTTTALGPTGYYAVVENQNTLGSLRSSSLEALLRMYETTCDFKYLYEFMEQAALITNLRSDKVGQSSWKYWFINSVYYHGRILQGFTHYVYLIKSNPGLYNTIIPAANRADFANKTTFGEFAEWLNVSNKEVMDFLTARYWRPNDECMCKPETISVNSCVNSPAPGNIMELNMQAPFGCSFIYLYLANPSITSYGVKAVEMARAYLTTHLNVLEYASATNSYKWYHDGWQKLGDGNVQKVYKEDIGHGGFDIMFPLLYNKYYSNITGTITAGQYFEDYQLVRFRNAFTKVIYKNYIPANCAVVNQDAFSCNVYGTCQGHFDNYYPNEANFLGYRMNAKNWTELYKFDNVSGAQSGSTVYSILMNYYINVESCLPITKDNYAGIAIVGLADMAVANRKKENVYCIGYPANGGLGFTFTVSPNPGTEKITIDSDDSLVKIVVTDLMGKEMSVTENANTVNTSDLENGSYFVKVYAQKGGFSSKTFIISR